MKNIQEKFLGFIAALFAALDVIEGFLSYVRLAAVLFWEEYGETIKVGAVRFVLLSMDATGEVLLLGRKTRAAFDHWLSQKADLAFYAMTES